MKCFIGHSFKEEDEEIVNKIIKFIDSQGIDCKTGERSQNTPISQKVIERMTNCDIFIGIFTRGKKLDTGNKLFKKKNNMYTTSNWVIQESGFAIGRNLRIIFLVEDLIEDFPKLQADLEYIPFDRNKPLDEAFTKLSQMITGLTQNKDSNEITTQSANLEETNEQISDINEEIQNNDNDNQTKIFYKMLDAIYDNKDYQLLENIYNNEYKPLLSEADDILKWDAWFFNKAHLLGQSYALSKLLNLKSEHGNNYNVLSELAKTYENMTEYEKAKEIYLEIANLYQENPEKTDSYISACCQCNICISQNGQYLDAINNLKKLLEENKDKEHEKNIILSTLANLSLKNKDFNQFYVFAESALACSPGDTSLRFDLAYNYSKNGYKQLSFLHYKKLIITNPSSSALNNIGAAYEYFKMKIKSVNSYTNAIELKNTLSMANLASIYLENGFINEAKKLIDQANNLSSGDTDVPIRIGNVQSRITKIVEEENNIENDLLEAAKRENNFIIKYSQKYCVSSKIDIKTISGLWNTHWGKQRLEFKSNTFSFRFKENEKSDKEYTAIELSGEIINQTINYQIKITDINENNSYISLLGDGGKSIKYEGQGYGVINEDNNNIQLMERSKEDKYTFYDWEKDAAKNQTNP